MHSADFLLFEEKNPENLSHFSDFHGSKVKGVDEADIKPSRIPPSFTKATTELRERHSFFVHFQAVPFPEVRFSFIFSMLYRNSFTETAEMLSGEPELAAWVLPKTSLNATVPFLLFSYWQRSCHSCVGDGSPFPTAQEYHYKQ